MPFPLMRIEDRDTDHRPTSRRSSIALTESLKLELNCAPRAMRGIAVGRPQEVFHVLYCCQHRFNRLLWNPECLEHQGSNGVGDTIVAVGCVDRAETSGYPRLADNIIEENFGQGAVVSSLPFFAVDFLRHPVVLSNIVHHPYSINEFVGKIEICLHQQYSSQFANQCAPKHFLQHNRESTGPSF